VGQQRSRVTCQLHMDVPLLMLHRVHVHVPPVHTFFGRGFQGST